MPPSLGSSQGQSSDESKKKRRKNMIDTSDKDSSSKKRKSKKHRLADAEADTQPITLNQLNAVNDVEVEVNEEFRAQDSLMQQWLLDNPAPEPDPPVVENEIEIIDLDQPTQSINAAATTIASNNNINNSNNTIAQTSVIKPTIPGPAVAAVIKSTSTALPPTKILPITFIAPRPSSSSSSSSAATTTVISNNVSAYVSSPYGRTLGKNKNNKNNSIVPSTTTTSNNNNTLATTTSTNTSSEIILVEVLDPGSDNFRLTNFSFLGRYKNTNDNVILSGKPKLSNHSNIMNILAPQQDVDIDIAAIFNGQTPEFKGTLGIDVSISRPLRGQIPSTNNDVFFVKVTDLFYPVLDDPYEAGKVACLSLLNKLFAVGLVQVDKILMHLTLANDLKAEQRDVVIPKIIKGFQEVALSVGSRVSGGHTLLNPWISIGGVATCISTMDELILSQTIVPGDFLVLTKPLGLGVSIIANEILQAKGEKLEDLLNHTKLTEEDLSTMFDKAKKLMLESNKMASQLMHKYQAHGACDLEFGLLPSSQNLCGLQKQKSSNVPLKFRILNLPCIKNTWEVSRQLNLKLEQGFACEISGGLLIALDKKSTQLYLKELNELQKCKLWQASVVGVVELNNTFEWTAELGANARVLPK